MAERAEGLLAGLTLSQVTVDATAEEIIEQAKKIAIARTFAGCRRPCRVIVVIRTLLGGNDEKAR